VILIQNAKIMPMAGRDIAKGDILINDEGKIEAIGRGLDAPEDVEVVDASNLLALPGFVDGHCHLGMFEDGMAFEGDDGNEATDPVTPQLRAIDAVNPYDYTFEEARQSGVTTVVTGPGSANPIGGQFIAIKTAGRTVDEMVIRAPHSLKAALGENPKRVYNALQKTPMTRMATAALMRETFVQAQEYADKMKSDDPEKRPERDLKMEIVTQVLSREIPMKFHAHRADDIVTAIRLAQEFNIRYSIEHATEGYLVTDILKESGAKILLGPLITERSKIELRNLRMEAPARLHEAGVKFSIITDHGVVPIQYLHVCAALAAREGLPVRTALEAITIEAARIVDLEHRVGSLEAGKDADIVLWDGHPLTQYKSRVVRTYINGKCVYQRK
jgi:imidazolonepropionase-like amidohydrolase